MKLVAEAGKSYNRGTLLRYVMMRVRNLLLHQTDLGGDAYFVCGWFIQDMTYNECVRT